MKEYGYFVEGDGLICPKCADNPQYKGVLTTAEAEGYPDGYTCADCGAVIEGESLQERADRTNPYLLTTKREGK